MKKFSFLLPLLGIPLAAGSLATCRAGLPQTLLEIAHVTSQPSPLSESVVIIIDAQREYVDGRLPLPDVSAALAQTQRLLLRARAAGVPIIHFQQFSAPGRGIFQPGSPSTAFTPESEPRAGEIIITKSLPNAFANTTLAETLQRLGRKHLVISGYMTHLAVSATARAALDQGYRTTVIADACATRDLPDGAGGIIPAAIVHRVALAELADRFATVVATLDQIPN